MSIHISSVRTMTYNSEESVEGTFNRVFKLTSYSINIHIFCAGQLCTESWNGLNIHPSSLQVILNISPTCNLVSTKRKSCEALHIYIYSLKIYRQHIAVAICFRYLFPIVWHNKKPHAKCIGANVPICLLLCKT